MALEKAPVRQLLRRLPVADIVRFSERPVAVDQLMDGEIWPLNGRAWCSLSTRGKPFREEAKIALVALRRIVGAEVDIAAIQSNDGEILGPIVAILGLYCSAFHSRGSPQVVPVLLVSGLCGRTADHRQVS